MTPQSCIDLARYTINDTDSAFYRQSNDELLKYFNDGLKEAATIAKEFFLTTADFPCTAGQTEQVLTFADTQEFVGVLRIKGGKAVHPMDLDAFQKFNPNWTTDVAGAAQNWTKMPGEKLRFYVYPKAPNLQVLEVNYIRNPATYALADPVTDVPNTWEAALSDYIIYRAETKDDEFSNSGRAVAAYNAFLQKITGSSQA